MKLNPWAIHTYIYDGAHRYFLGMHMITHDGDDVNEFPLVTNLFSPFWEGGVE